MDKTVEKRAINTLQIMMDNSHLGDFVIVYEDGDQQVVTNSELPKRYLYEPSGPGIRPVVKVPKGKKIMLFDEEERKVVALGAQQVYDYLDECLIFEEGLNCTKKQLAQTNQYFKNLGAKIIE